MKIMYIQYAGDFAEAYDRLITAGGEENYYGQRYSVEAVLRQVRAGHRVVVLTLTAPRGERVLEPDLVAVGLGGGPDIDHGRVAACLDAWTPERVVLRLPDARLLHSLHRRGIETFPVFADSFERRGLQPRGRWQDWRLGRALRLPNVRWVANHQLNAARSLARLGVDSARILPYDWEHPDRPENWRKAVPEDLTQRPLRLFYAGGLDPDKGLDDLLAAVAWLERAGRVVELTIAGRGDERALERRLARLALRSRMAYAGVIPHRAVLAGMHHADLVVVPSRHAYPEGLPMTIMEGLMVHTPVIASDHPMFVGRVGGRGAVRFFPERDPQALAQTVLAVCDDPARYRRMCEAAPLEWHDLVLPLKWGDMIDAWLEDVAAPALAHHSLAALDERAGPTLPAGAMQPV